MFNNEGTVRRCDLKLRLEYLGLMTTIYRINEDHYAIKCVEGTYTNTLSEIAESMKAEIHLDYMKD